MAAKGTSCFTSCRSRHLRWQPWSSGGVSSSCRFVYYLRVEISSITTCDGGRLLAIKSFGCLRVNSGYPQIYVMVGIKASEVCQQPKAEPVKPCVHIQQAGHAVISSAHLHS